MESVLLELTAGLHRLGHKLVFAAVQDAGCAESPVLRRAADRGVEIIRLDIPLRSYLLEFWRLRDTIRQVSPDIVHTHGYRADLIGGLAARTSGTPWVTTAHGFAGGDRKNRFYESLQVRAFRSASAVIAVSEKLKARLVRAKCRSDKILVLPNAWATKPLLSRQDARRRLRLGEGAPVIGWVGRLSWEKGADVFLRALASLGDPRWRASIIGDGRERPALEALATSLGIADRIVWHGLVPEAASLYAAFDAWVLSSRTEGTPIALFEAMAARVPAVVTAVGGVPDVVSPAEALLVPPERPELLGLAIADILANLERAASRAEVAHRRLLDAYAADAWLEAHLALYASIQTNSTIRT